MAYAQQGAQHCGAADEEEIQLLVECTGCSQQECRAALQVRGGNFDAAALQLVDEDNPGVTDVLSDFRADWLAELGQLGLPADLDYQGAADPVEEEACGRGRSTAVGDGRPMLPRKIVWEVSSQHLLQSKDLAALWRTNSENALLVLSSLAGRPLRTPALRSALLYLARRGCKLAIAERQVYASSTAGGLTTFSYFDLLGGQISPTLDRSLVSLDIDCWSMGKACSLLNDLTSLRFLRVWSLDHAGVYPLGESVGVRWPQSIQAAALPLQLLEHMQGQPPKRLLVFLRDVDLDLPYARTACLHEAAHAGSLEELHLIDTSRTGCLTLRGMFGKEGLLRGAPLRRFLLYRETLVKAGYLEGFFCALKVALPSVEELYAGYTDRRPLAVQKAELRCALEAQPSALRRLATTQQAWSSSVPPDGGEAALVHVRLDMPHDYDHVRTRPVGLSGWDWTCFGSGSPLCPRSTGDVLSYSSSFGICSW